MAKPLDYISSIDFTYSRDEKAIFTTKRIGEFSYDAKKRELELDSANLKYVFEGCMNRKLNIDLTEGIHEQVEKWRTESLDKIFGWLIKSNAVGTSLGEALEGCEFVSRRGPLSRIAIAPYIWRSFNDKSQKLACVKYKGAIFIREFTRSEDGEDDKKEWDPFIKKATFAGRKFEQLVTVDTPNGRQPDTSVAVDPNPEFNGVFKADLSVGGRSLKIFNACEFDAMRASDGKFVELKTQINCIGYGKYFSFKALSWYFQSFLIGIDTLLVGLRDENFMLTRMDYYPLEDLQSFFKKSRIDSQKCVLFLHHFLSTIKNELNKLPEGTILVTERQKMSPQFIFTAIELGDEKWQKEYAVISKEFREHNWTK